MQYDRQITVTVGASRKAVLWQPQTMLLSELYTRLGAAAAGAAAAGQDVYRGRIRALRPPHGGADRHGAGGPLHL